MEIRPVGAELLQAVWRTGGQILHDEANSVFRNFFCEGA
jgi:hypothetical protein